MARDVQTLTLDLEFAGLAGSANPPDWEEWTENEQRCHTRALTVGSWAARAAPEEQVAPERLNHGIFWGKEGDIIGAMSLQSLGGGDNGKKPPTLAKTVLYQDRRYTATGGTLRGARQPGALLYELVEANLYPGETWRYGDFWREGNRPENERDPPHCERVPCHPFRWSSEGVMAPYKGREMVLTRPVWFLPLPHPDDEPTQALATRLCRFIQDDPNSYRMPWHEKLPAPADVLFLNEMPLRHAWWDNGGRLIVRLVTKLGAGPTFVASPAQRAELIEQLERLEKER